MKRNSISCKRNKKIYFSCQFTGSYNSDGFIAYFDSVQVTQVKNNVFTYFRMESFGLKKIPSHRNVVIYIFRSVHFIEIIQNVLNVNSIISETFT